MTRDLGGVPMDHPRWQTVASWLDLIKTRVRAECFVLVFIFIVAPILRQLLMLLAAAVLFCLIRYCTQPLAQPTAVSPAHEFHHDRLLIGRSVGCG